MGSLLTRKEAAARLGISEDTLDAEKKLEFKCGDMPPKGGKIHAVQGLPFVWCAL